MRAPQAEGYFRGARASRFSVGCGRGSTFALGLFLSFFLWKWGIARRSAGAQKEKGRGGGGKGREGCTGSCSLQVAGVGEWDGTAHTHTHTRTQRDGRRQVGKGAKFLETQRPALMASKQSGGGKKREKKSAGEGRRDAKLPFPPPSSAGGGEVSPDAASCWEAWYEAKWCFDRLCSTLSLSSSKV